MFCLLTLSYIYPFRVQNEKGDFDNYRYLFAQLEYYPKTTIILEDNRQVQAMNASSASSSLPSISM